MLSLLVPRLFTPNHYKKAASFSAGTGAVQALALSSDGHILAAGGLHGIQLWDLRTRKSLVTAASEPRGAVSCATWVKMKHTYCETLCYGTSLGYLVLLRSNPADNQYHEICARRLNSGFEITCITTWVSSGSACHIAIGTWDNVIQVLLFTANSQLQSVFAGRLDNTVPKSIAFTNDGSIYVFGFGNVVRVSEDGKVMMDYRCQSVIGSAAVHPKKGMFVIDNMADGLTLYRLNNGQSVRTFKMDPPSIPVPKRVAFAEEGKIVLGGSDNGCIYVFNRRTGELIETLRHAGATLIQTIAVCDIDGECIIACATLNIGHKKTAVHVWSYEYGSRNTPSILCNWRSVVWVSLSRISIALILLIILNSILRSVALHGWISDRVTWWQQGANMPCIFRCELASEDLSENLVDGDSEALHQLAHRIVEIIRADQAMEGGVRSSSLLVGPQKEIPSVIYL